MEKDFSLRFFITLLGAFFIQTTAATETGRVPTKAPPAGMVQEMIRSNRAQAKLELTTPLFRTTEERRPYAEYNEAGYLFMNSDFEFSSEAVKRGILKNLPENVTAIVFIGSRSDSIKERIKNSFVNEISPDRLKVVYLPKAPQGFWARDGIPVPTVSANGDGRLTLVDAKYYHGFEPDEEVAEIFQSQLIRHDYYFEGGNFMANGKGDCLIVNNSDAAEVPDRIFEVNYGCINLIRLPHVKGIGHADESVKFVSDDTVLTDTDSYIPVLKRAGFNVVTLPRPNKKYETYVNSLIVEDIVYLPIFGQNKDQLAQKVYEDLGFKVIPMNTSRLSNSGLGSIHCITMTYPPSPLTELLKSLGGELL